MYYSKISISIEMDMIQLILRFQSLKRNTSWIMRVGVRKHRTGPKYKSFCMDHSVLTMDVVR